MADPFCPRCGQQQCSRLRREGAGQLLMGLFGRFPWECALCRKQFYLPKRGKRRKQSARLSDKPAVSLHQTEEQHNADPASTPEGSD